MVRPKPPTRKTVMSLPDATVITRKIYEMMSSDNASSHADVTLVTSDHVRIPAIRMLLSITSSFFHKLSSPDFAERNHPLVSVSIASSCLNAILEFVYTDDCSLIRVIRNKTKASSVVQCKEVTALVELAEAAEYARVERLVVRCREAVKIVIQTSPHSACPTVHALSKGRSSGGEDLLQESLLQEAANAIENNPEESPLRATVRALSKGRSSWGRELLQESLDAIEKNPEDSLLRSSSCCNLSCGLMHLDEQGADDVFAIVKKQGAALDRLFQALIVWGTGGSALLQQWKRPSWADSWIVVNTGNMRMMGERLEAAKRIASWFHVSSFNPRFLSDVVEGSGLLEQDKLAMAYKKQSIHLGALAKDNAEKISSGTETIDKLNKELKEVRAKLSRNSH